MNNKILTLLGFAAKAGRLSYGMDMSVEAIKTKKSFLAVAAFDVSEKSKKEIAFHTNNKKVPFIILTDADIETLSKAVGKKCGIISVNDRAFAEAIKGGYANDQQI